MNRTIFLAAALIAPALLAVPASAQDAGDGVISLDVSGMDPVQGHLMVALFDSEAAWSGGEPVDGVRASVDGASVEIRFRPLPAGDYAIRLYHDVDGDGELDTNLVGIPTEPFAFSNNALGRMGPASWADAHFTHDGAATAHTITLD